MMIILLPAGILILASLIIIILQQRSVKLGYSWFLAVGAAVAAWGNVLAFHWIPVQSFVLGSKNSIFGIDLQLVYKIDLFSFPFAFSLVTLGLVVILTDLGRLQLNESQPWIWAGILAIVGTGYLAIISVSPLMIIFSWTIIDVIEIIFILNSLEDQKLVQESIIALAARVAGTMMVVAATFYSRSLNQVLDLSNVSAPVGLLLLLAAGFRLGVIPLHLPYREIKVRRGLGSIIRLVGPASSLVILGRLPVPFVLPEWGIWLSVLLCITMIYASLMWLTADNEITGRPFWLICFSAFAIGCVLRSQPAGAIGWGVGLILSGGLLFIYASRKKQLIFLPILGLIGISGLPFTPLASSWKCFLSPQVDGVSIVFVLTHLIMMAGYIRHTLKTADSFDDLARWAQILLPVGLLLLVLVEWFLGVFGWPGSFSIGSWLVNGIVYVLAIAGWVAFLVFHIRERRFWTALAPFTHTAKQIFEVFTKILSLQWLLRLGVLIYRIIQKIVESLTLILEGEGGILWALLLLVLVFSLAKLGGGF